MDRHASFVLAFSLLIAASLVVGVSGWILFVRDRRLAKAKFTLRENAERIEGS